MMGLSRCGRCRLGNEQRVRHVHLRVNGLSEVTGNSRLELPELKDRANPQWGRWSRSPDTDSCTRPRLMAVWCYECMPTGRSVFTDVGSDVEVTSKP